MNVDASSMEPKRLVPETTPSQEVRRRRNLGAS
jgi:hypothetical protein